MVNKKQNIIPYVTQLQCNTVHSISTAVTIATTDYAIEGFNCSIITLPPLPTQNQFNNIFYITSSLQVIHTTIQTFHISPIH